MNEAEKKRQERLGMEPTEPPEPLRGLVIVALALALALALAVWGR